MSLLLHAYRSVLSTNTHFWKPTERAKLRFSGCAKNEVICFEGLGENTIKTTSDIYNITKAKQQSSTYTVRDHFVLLCAVLLAFFSFIGRINTEEVLILVRGGGEAGGVLIITCFLL